MPVFLLVNNFDVLESGLDLLQMQFDVRGTINGSLGAEFQNFQRSLVDEFLNWQARIVREYKRQDQFITNNFDLGWKQGSYGIQSDVNSCKSWLKIPFQ